MAHIAANLGHILPPILAMLFLFHIVRGRHHTAFWTIALGGLAIALLTNQAQMNHLLSHVGNTLAATVNQLIWRLTRRILNDGRVRAAGGLWLAGKLGGPLGVLSLGIGTGARAFWRSRIRHEVVGLAVLLVAWLWVKSLLGPVLGGLVFITAGALAWRYRRDQIVQRWRALKMQSQLRYASGFITNGAGRLAISRTRTTPSGFTSNVRFSHGAHDENLDLDAGAAHCRNVHALRVTRDEHRASRGTLTVLSRDPFADVCAQGPVPWPERGEATVWEPIPFGLDENGAEVTLKLFDEGGANTFLFAGSRGSGKSNALSIPLAAAALDPATEIYLIDPKREMTAWQDRATDYADTAQDAVTMLDELNQKMTYRFDLLAENCLRVIEPGIDVAPIVLVCEEFGVLSQAKGVDFQGALMPIILQGRAPGIAVLAAVQHATTTVIDSQLRENLTERFAFRCKTADQSEAVLGRGSAGGRYDAVLIPPNQKGVCVAADQDGGLRRIRTYRIDDDQLAEISGR